MVDRIRIHHDSELVPVPVRDDSPPFLFAWAIGAFIGASIFFTGGFAVWRHLNPENLPTATPTIEEHSP